MLNVTFFTSNVTKLAHAKYLAEGLPLRFGGFRERTYHAPYDEPRVSSRPDLLDASYRSAVEQGKKARILSSRHFFILEDTSVRLEALSDGGNEVPGLDIKYWIKGKTLQEVNDLISGAGGDRRATVRSDVVLHIPLFYKQLWGLEQDYLIFVGEQHGRVTENEIGYEPNPIFPWLDAKSFNKWFIPDGAEIPFGSMDISLANQFDFRRKSFSNLFEFLESKLLLADESQEELALADRAISVICGYTCAGKTTASQHLASSYDFLHVEASDFMYLSYYVRHDVRGDMPIAAFAERALRERPEIAAEQIANYLAAEGMPPSVISGFRSPKEVIWLQDWLARRGGATEVLFVEAAQAVRFDRMRARMRPGDVVEFSAFEERDEQQQGMGLDEIGATATKVPNAGSLTDYHRLVESALGLSVGNATIQLAASDVIDRASSFASLKLEDAILLALLTQWTDDENREYFTTAEIARLIKTHLSVRKHKDNVSRYFNQNFYPYYGITIGDGHRRYRLSNTGYGKALRLGRRLSSAETDNY